MKVTINKSRIKISKLKEKADKLKKRYSDYTFEYEGLAIESLLLEKS